MIRAVMGVGPRSGTSFTMRMMHEAGLPVHWDSSIDEKMPAEGNPQGYYETHFQDYRSLEDVIVKVWPMSARFADVEKMVVLERDRDSQIASIEKQMVRERALLDTLGITWSAEDFRDRSAEALNLYLSIPHLRVRTEDLDERIDEIINYMRY